MSLDDPISKHLSGLPKWSQAVTLRQLANHTAGFANYTAMPEFEPVKHQSIGLSEILAMTAKKSPTHPVGEQWAYSNTHYYLLGVVIEKVTGQPYLSQLKTDLFKSSALENVDSYAYVDLVSGTQPSLAGGKKISAPVKIPHRSGPSAAGELSMSGNEIAAWGLQVAQLEAKTLKRFTQGSKTNPNYGLGIFSNPKTTWINHGGGIDGFQTYFSVDPKTKSMVAVLGNCISCGVSEIGKWTQEYLAADVAPPLPTIAVDPTAKFQSRMIGDYKLDAKSVAVAKGLGPNVAEMIGAATLSSSNDQLIFKPVGQGPMRLMRDDGNLVGTSGITVVDVTPAKGKVKSFVLQQGPYKFRYERK